MSLEFLSFLFIFIFGALIGSFLNVVALRHNTGMSLGGRSFCLSCGVKLLWHDLIPIFSYIFLKGRCRSCSSKFSPQYPLVELLTAFLFVAITLTFAQSPLEIILHAGEIIYFFVLFSLLIVIGIYDIRHMIIPNFFVYNFILLSVFVPLGFFTGELSHLALSAGPLLASPVLFLWLISRGRWIGLGDAKLLWGIGWMLGLSSGFTALLLSVWTGALYGVALLLYGKSKALLAGGKRYTMKSELSFAPFLIFGTILVFVFGLSFSDIQIVFTF